jgi:site-specific recombinase XerC
MTPDSPRWPPAAAPLFVGADGERISRGTRKYRVLCAFVARASTLTAHGAHSSTGCATPSFATEPANSAVDVYTLMNLLGHESMVTSQRYVTAAGTETRTAAAQNKL